MKDVNSDIVSNTQKESFKNAPQKIAKNENIIEKPVNWWDMACNRAKEEKKLPSKSGNSQSK